MPPDLQVAVVVPTFQRAERLPGLIAALEAQTFSRELFEVVIADDCSADETQAVLKDLIARSPLTLRTVRTERNSGPAAARNAACRATEAPLLAFTDDDCTPVPGWLAAGVERFDGDVAVVQGKTIPDPSVDLGRWYATRWIEEFSNRFEACNIFWRADVLRKVGGFDEAIPFFGEDSVPGWHARRLGVGERFAPDAVVHHAVTHPDLRWRARYALQWSNWAMLVRRFPELRDDVLWRRYFVKSDHAKFVMAVAGVLLARRWRPAAALALPYLQVRWPRRLRRDDLEDFLIATGFDALAVGGLIVRSIREGTLVL